MAEKKYDSIVDKILKGADMNQCELASELSVTPMTITQWRTRGVPVKSTIKGNAGHYVNMVLECERISGVSRHEIDPIIYPLETRRAG